MNTVDQLLAERQVLLDLQKALFEDIKLLSVQVLALQRSCPHVNRQSLVDEVGYKCSDCSYLGR